jgi:hypothetical protein
VRLKPADDLPLMCIQLAGPRGRLPLAELVRRQLAANGPSAEVQVACDLGDRQAILVVAVFDLAVQLVVDHG